MFLKIKKIPSIPFGDNFENLKKFINIFFNDFLGAFKKLIL